MRKIYGECVCLCANFRQNNACVLRYTRGDGKFVYKTPRIKQVYRRIRIIRYTKFMQIRVPRNVYHKTIALLFMNVPVVVVFVCVHLCI